MRDGSGFGLVHTVWIIDSGGGVCLAGAMARLLPDRFFFSRIRWSPIHKVVLDPITGTVLPGMTDEERAKRGLPVPWKPSMMVGDMQAPVMP